MAMSSSQEADAVMGDINMTPMVDVLLVLLIIFMIVTPALLKGFNAQLPQALNLKTREDDPKNTVLGIDNKGAYYLNKVKIDKANLEAGLRAEMAKHKAADEMQLMYVKADRNLTWEVVNEALIIARLAEVPMAAVISDPAPGAEDKKGAN
ncbi:MAG: biopolymer transporter ExbD [Longimicrobiales bacterium]